MSDWKNVQYKDGKMRTSEGGGGGSSTFAGLDDVSFSDLQNGQVPKYNSTTQKWENANESGGGGTVTDVEVDGVSVVNQQGVAEIEMPNVPVQDVQVDGTSVVNAQGIAEITMPTPPTPDYPVTDVKVNGTSVVSNKQALIKSYKEVTLAEYQALPSSKTSDGVLYCIKDAPSGVEGFPPLIYSDEEREVGVWRDGKPLYQRTIPCNLSVVPNWAVLDDSVSYENLANLIIESSDGEMIFFNSFSSLPRFRIDAFSQNDHKLYYYIETAGNYLITIQYTKSTDVAGSGQWATGGIPTHHYSTTEQVIGTWIDGKPLYEKTVHKTFTEMDWNGDRKIFQAHPSGSKIRHIEAIAYSSAWGMSFGMGEHNFAGSESSSSYLYLGMFYQNVCMGYTGSRSDFTSASPEVYCTVQYTKNSD